MTATIVWISGASAGIGAGLARHQPHAGARVIHLGHEPAEGLEHVPFDLTQPATWSAAAEHLATTLQGFAGRAILLQNAFAPLGSGLIGRVDRAEYAAAMTANFAAPLLLGEAFLRALHPGVQAGLMMMSSGAAAHALPGQSAYGATKAGIEQWVRVARAEFRQRPDTWIVAVRPGLVHTPSAVAQSQADPAIYPRAAQMAENLRTFGVDIDTAAQRIWAALPPADPRQAVISFDPAPQGAPAGR